MEQKKELFEKVFGASVYSDGVIDFLSDEEWDGFVSFVNETDGHFYDQVNSDTKLIAAALKYDLPANKRSQHCFAIGKMVIEMVNYYYDHIQPTLVK